MAKPQHQGCKLIFTGSSKNSNMYSRKLYLVIYWALLVLICKHVEAGPMKRLSRMVREVYPEIEPENEGNQAQVCIVGDVVYGMDETVPAEQPCLKCKCQPPGVQCETIQCVKRPGCKAIHKPNKCCPEYQCECEHNGKIYANGEKLETPPGGECKVCFCRGGEVQCAEVSCYIRKDCEGKRVPGTCCPKFDHCPPIDPILNRPSYTTEIILQNSNKDRFELWPITSAPPNSTENVLSPTSNDFQEENKIPDTNYFEPTTANYKDLEVEDLQRDAPILPRITIQEIIPERKEIPITAPPKSELEPQGTLLIEEAEEFSNNSNDLVVTDVDTDSSEISETFQQPPPVLRIGDKLLFLQKGGFDHEKYATEPSSIITIIGAEGLQRGFEESAEVHEIKIESMPPTLNETDLIENNSFIQKKIDESDSILLNTAASTHILSLVKRKNKPQPSTTEISSTESTSEELFETILNATESSGSTSSQDVLNETTTRGSIDSRTIANSADNLTRGNNKNRTENVDAMNAKKIESSTTVNTKPYEPITDQNPEYPPIPEIMSPNMDDTSQRFDIETSDKEHVDNTSISDTKILPVVLEIRSNKTILMNTTNSEWLKRNPGTLINTKAALPDELLNQPSPIDVEDITEVLNSTEITTSYEEYVSEYVTLSSNLSNQDKMVDNSTAEDNVRSIENIEVSSEDSGELTTPKNSHASLLTNENASIEGNKDLSEEANDMVNIKEKFDDRSIEKTTIRDVRLIDSIDETKKNGSEIENIDVEFIDTKLLNKNKRTIEKTVSSTTSSETLLQQEKLPDTPLKIIKRESSPQGLGDEVFKNLNEELSEEQTERNFSEDEDEKEANVIFKELLEDTSTKSPIQNGPLSRVSSAFSQFSSSGKTPDANILGILSNFFSSQYRQ